MGKAHRLAAILALGAFWRPGPALADGGLQALGDVSLGWTDNVRSSPDYPPPGVPPKVADGFLVLSPGIAYSTASPGALQRFGYTYSLTLYREQTDANASAQRLDYRGVFDLSPRVGLVLGAAASQARPYSSMTLTSAGASELGAWLPGSETFVVFRGDQLLSIDVTPEVRAWQGAELAVGTPMFGADAPRTVEGAGRLGAERLFRADAVGLETRGAYSVVTSAVGADGAAVGTVRQVVATAVGTWRHDFGLYFASRLEAGATRVQRLESGRGFWHPTGTAALGYATDWADAELAYAHRVTTNVTLGQSSVVDEVRLRALVPLTDGREVFAEGSAGAQRGRLIEEDATLAAHVNVYLADAALAWRVTPWGAIALRYQYAEQRSDAPLPPLPLSFIRNTVMVVFGLRFPPDSELPQRYRAPRRVDRSDEIR